MVARTSLAEDLPWLSFPLSATLSATSSLLKYGQSSTAVLCGNEAGDLAGELGMRFVNRVGG